MRRIALLCPLLAVACGGPVDVNGSYTISLTNGVNACQFSNWTAGDTTQNVPFSITQSGGDATGVVGGLVGAYVTLLLGSATFTGKVTGPNLDLTLYGKTQATKGSCSYTINARAQATLSGDFLGGTIDYTAATNGSPDCGTITGCKSTQQFNGTRPPTGR